jgi:hypothetical protein
MAIEALFAVWGALANGNANEARAADAGQDATTFQRWRDFAATVNNNGRVSHYACEEGQTINFQHPSS